MIVNLKNEKFKFARSMLYNGRRPGIEDGIGFQQGNQNNTTALARNSFSGTIQQIRSIGFQEGYVSSSTALFARCGADSLPPISLVFWLVVTRGAGCVFNAALLSPCR
jgi:hypothetical protein